MAFYGTFNRQHIIALKLSKMALYRIVRGRFHVITP